MNLSRLVRYLALTTGAMLLSSGAVVAAFLDNPAIDASVGLLVVPLTAVMLAAVAVNNRVLVPQLLLRGRYAAYIVLMAVAAYLVPLSGFLIEYLAREWAAIPHRVASYLSPWVFADALSSAVLVAMLLAGLSLITLYHRWQRSALRLRSEEAALTHRIRMIKGRLGAGKIFAWLDGIIALAGHDAAGANRGILELSAYLRSQLYDSEFPSWHSAAPEMPEESPGMADFLSSPRRRLCRHLLLQVALALIAFGAFFAAPDRPVFTGRSLRGVLAFYVVLNILAYGNILFLFPRFMRRGLERRYFVAVGCAIAVITVGVVVLQALTYDGAVYVRSLPLWVMALSTAGSMLSLALFLAATASVMAVQNRIRVEWRMVRLRAATARCELEYLRKQINPHFLFNVLNNAGVLVYADPQFAVGMLRQLRYLLQYQLADTEREYTGLQAEVSFLRSYMALEQSRKSRLECRLKAPDTDVRIPTLLFIPFVENAVKYCAVPGGKGLVEVQFTLRGDRLEFRCGNSYDSSAPHPSSSGGLGVANTRRRLEILYGRGFTLEQRMEEHRFVTCLTIPL